MNLRIPARLEPRLRAHAARLGLSLNAAATHLLGATLPHELAEDMTRWVDEQGPSQPPLPEAPPLPSADKLLVLSFVEHPHISRPYTRIGPKSQWLQTEAISWMVLAPRAVRVRILHADPDTRVYLEGPWLRSSGGDLSLLDRGEPIEDGQVLPLRGPIELKCPETLKLKAWTSSGHATVVLELLAQNIRDDAWSYPILDTGGSHVGTYTPPTPRLHLQGHTTLEKPLPLRVPLGVDGSPLIRLHPTSSLRVCSLDVPWGTWRLVGLELLVDTDPGKGCVNVFDYQIGGSANLLVPQGGLSAYSFRPGAPRHALRSNPVVRSPNVASVHLEQLSDGPATVTGYALGLLTLVKDREAVLIEDRREALEEGDHATYLELFNASRSS